MYSPCSRLGAFFPSGRNCWNPSPVPVTILTYSSVRKTGRVAVRGRIRCTWTSGRGPNLTPRSMASAAASMDSRISAGEKHQRSANRVKPVSPVVVGEGVGRAVTRVDQQQVAERVVVFAAVESSHRIVGPCPEPPVFFELAGDPVDRGAGLPPRRGEGRSRGGMRPDRSWSRISCQVPAVAGEEKSGSSVSKRRLSSCLFLPWHARQFFERNCRTVARSCLSAAGHGRREQEGRGHNQLLDDS